MSNQELMDKGNSMMDDTDQAIERGKKIVQETINVGTDTSAALKAQTEQMSRVVNELDSIHFSLKKASKLVKEIGRQVSLINLLISSLYHHYLLSAAPSCPFHLLSVLLLSGCH
jgi:SNARE protein